MCHTPFVSMWFVVWHTLCFIVPFCAAFTIYLGLLPTLTPWSDYVRPFVYYNLSVMLYLSVQSVQSLLMCLLADHGVVAKVDRTFLQGEIQRLRLEIVGLSNIVTSFAKGCKQLRENNNNLIKDNRYLYSEYESLLKTLEFLHTTIRLHLMKKSPKDFEEWSLVLESETRRENQEEHDRMHQVQIE